MDEINNEITDRMERAKARYGKFASTHEAIGVALEEWDELKDAVRSNRLASIEYECMDLAAVLVRLASQIREQNYVWERSQK